jgi:hypothetical protein
MLMTVRRRLGVFLFALLIGSFDSTLSDCFLAGNCVTEGMRASEIAGLVALRSKKGSSPSMPSGGGAGKRFPNSTPARVIHG